VLHLKKIVGCPLNVFPNLVTMGGAGKQRSQNEHVECALKKSVAFFHGRQTTLDLGIMVDGRLSIRQDVIWHGWNTSSRSSGVSWAPIQKLSYG
jgi:hypothetical protein